MSDSGVQWTMEGSGAQLHCGPLRATAGFAASGISLIPTRWQQAAIHDVSVLATEGPLGKVELLRVADVYVRGGDLVVSYAKTEPQRLAPQIYWRAVFDPPRGIARVELVVSIQTDLLDSRPECQVGSYVMGAELFHTSRLAAPQFDALLTGRPGRRITAADSREHLFVFRRRELGFSYAEMVHPSDFVSADASLDGQQPPGVISRLFPERIEMGVIRRGRICGWFLPVENDLETAVELARQFVDEPLPLTA